MCTSTYDKWHECVQHESCTCITILLPLDFLYPLENSHEQPFNKLEIVSTVLPKNFQQNFWIKWNYFCDNVPIWHSLSAEYIHRRGIHSKHAIHIIKYLTGLCILYASSRYDKLLLPCSAAAALCSRLSSLSRSNILMAYFRPEDGRLGSSKYS